MSDWNATSYDAFGAQRQRAARDLLAGVTGLEPGVIVDLGCGSGLSTALLCERWPRAAVSGVDNSPDMLRAAMARVPGAAFVEADIAAFAFAEPPDLIFANASLHWLSDHTQLLPRLLQELTPGGILAVQMPDNLDEPSHALMRAVAEEAAFREHAASAPGQRGRLLSLAAYYDSLAAISDALSLWRTTYVHALAGPDAIADWFATTGLKPYLDALDGERRTAYLERYREALAGAYPRQRDGRVLLGMPRLFIVARRPV